MMFGTHCEVVIAVRSPKYSMPGVGGSTGEGVGAGVGLGVGAGVGLGVGLGVGAGVGLGVGGLGVGGTYGHGPPFSPCL